MNLWGEVSGQGIGKQDLWKLSLSPAENGGCGGFVNSQICRGMGQSMKRKGQVLAGQNQSICTGTFPSSTSSLMLIELVSYPLQWVNPPCPQEERVPTKAPSLTDPQQGLIYSPKWGLLLRFAPMGTAAIPISPQEDPQQLLWANPSETLPETFQDAWK